MLQFGIGDPLDQSLIFLGIVNWAVLATWFKLAETSSNWGVLTAFLPVLAHWLFTFRLLAFQSAILLFFRLQLSFTLVQLTPQLLHLVLGKSQLLLQRIILGNQIEARSRWGDYVRATLALLRERNRTLRFRFTRCRRSRICGRIFVFALLRWHSR